jgi:hypothetical protein
MGKIIDPSMDKVLILVPLGTFAYRDTISVWWVVPIFIREILITFFRIAWMFEGKAIGAEKLGKVKFGAQVFAVAFIFLFYLSIDFSFLNASVVIARRLMLFSLISAVALTVISGFSFIYSQRENFRSPEFRQTEIYEGEDLSNLGGQERDWLEPTARPRRGIGMTRLGVHRRFLTKSAAVSQSAGATDLSERYFN